MDPPSPSQDAVRELEAQSEFASECKRAFKKVKDLEKLLSWIHGACVPKGSDHPEMEAVYYETEAKMKRNINNLVACLVGFEDLSALFVKFTKGKARLDLASSLLRELVCDEETVAAVVEATVFFRGAFDYDEAVEQHKILPAEGVDAEYDSLGQEKKELDRELSQYLKEQCAHFRDGKLQVELQEAFPTTNELNRGLLLACNREQLKH